VPGRSGELERAYRESLLDRGYQPDRAQLHALSRLADLRSRLARGSTGHSALIGRLLMRQRRSVTAGRGVYLWGGVGRGKTFLMNLFHANLPVPSRREHFHRFMRYVHEELTRWRQVEDPLARVGAAIAAQARVLCLDELHVSDIADAMILSGLFTALDERGVTLVFTSNSPPDALYRDGLQRARFLPAIALIERRCEVVNVDAGVDYRLQQLEKAALYVDARAADAEAALARCFAAVAGGTGSPGGTLEVEGRSIPLRRLAAGVAWFDFAALCTGPRGTADYVEIARDFHTVVVSDVPGLDEARDDEARRFIALVDEFYDRSVKLVVSAAAPPDRLYRGTRLAFEFERTRSRLAEMQTHAYLAQPHRP
jgi:cell division protein ZapE